MRSWARRDSRRTRRPITTIGTTTSGTTISTSPVSFGLVSDQQRKAADQEQEVAQRLRQAGADHRLDHRGVGGQPREHLAGAGQLEEAGRQAGDVRVDLGAQVGDHPLAQPRDQVGAREGRGREHHDHDQRRLQRVVERARGGLRRSRRRSGSGGRRRTPAPPPAASASAQSVAATCQRYGSR